MKITRYARFALVWIALTGLPATSHAQGLDFLQQIGSDIDIKGLDKQWDPETQVMTVTGDVRIAYDQVVIQAKKAAYDVSAGEIVASDEVTVYQGGSIFKGDRIVFNTRTGMITGDGLRSRTGPILFEADGLQTTTGEVDVIHSGNTMITTHDSQDPNFRILAKSLEVYPGDKIKFKSPKVVAGKVPVLWLPFLTQPLEDELGYFFTPGYNTRWGGFLLNRYGMEHGDHTIAQYHLDLRSGRGVGIGADFFSQKFRNNPNIGKLTLYQTYDIDPEFDRQSNERAELSENRYRINFQHRIYLPGPEESTFYLDFDINKISDRLYYSDFFFSDSAYDPEPDNVISLIKRDDRYEASLSGRFQINDFITRDTRLPELAIDFTTQPIFNTGLFYRGSSSYGILSKELSDRRKDRLEAEIAAAEAEIDFVDALPDFEPTAPVSELERQIDELRGYVDGTGYHRLYSYHEVLYPTSLGPVQIIPRLGGGVARYTDVDNGVHTGTDFNREIAHLGVEVSTKWIREFDGIQSRRLGLDGLRHIVQPYVNYSYVDATEDTEGVIDRIDGNLTTTKLRPIDVPLTTNIDAIDTWNIVRAGMRHTLQTRRGEDTLNWLMLNTYIDSFIDDPEFDRDISSLHADISWKPLPWLRLQVDSQFPIDNNPANFTEVNTRLNWSPIDRLNIGLSHLMLQDHPVFDNSSLVSLSSYLRLTENWGFSTIHRFEAEDSQLEMQGYSIHRDLTSWTASLGALVLNNNGFEDEIGIILSLSLKEFPTVFIPLDLNPDPTR